MKTIIHVSILYMMLFLSTNIHAQKSIKFGVKDIKEVFKKPSDCTYCDKAFSFVNTVARIENNTKLLSTGKAKKRPKIFKRITKSLSQFAANATTEWKGLSIQLEQAGRNSEAHASAIKLQLNLERICELTNPPEFESSEESEESLSIIRELHHTIYESLNH